MYLYTLCIYFVYIVYILCIYCIYTLCILSIHFTTKVNTLMYAMCLRMCMCVYIYLHKGSAMVYKMTVFLYTEILCKTIWFGQTIWLEQKDIFV